MGEAIVTLSSGVKRIVVVGGGVAGLCASRELAGQGAAVLLVERGRIALRDARGPASSASVGVLTAPRSGSSPLRRLQVLAHGSWPSFARDLAEETGLSTGYSVPGSLRLERGAPPERARTKLRESFERAGVHCRWLEADEVRDLVPEVSGEFGAALHVPDEGVVDPRSLLAALRRSCLSRGVDIREESGEARIVAGDPLRIALATGEVISADACVVAAGAWSAGVLGLEPSDGPLGGEDGSESLPGTSPGPVVRPGFPVRPVRGQAVEVRLEWGGRPSLRFRPRGRDKDYHVVGRDGGLAWLGSTVEAVGFDALPTSSARHEILDATREALPGVRDGDVVDAWAGLRPQALLRGGPIVGPHPSRPGVWIHSGHYRSGILLAPFTARILAHALAGDGRAPQGHGGSPPREPMDPEFLRAFLMDR